MDFKNLLFWGTVVVLIVVIGAVVVLGSKDMKKAPVQETPAPQAQTQPQPTSLKIEDLVVGTGATAAAGKEITVNYKGTLTDGTKFDSSYDRNQPFKFTLGAGQVIAGWDQGFEGMKVGGKRRLTIPAELGYGSRGAGASIPPNATLIFEVELLNVGN